MFRSRAERARRRAIYLAEFRARSRGALAGSPPGAGGRLLDLYTPRPPR